MSWIGRCGAAAALTGGLLAGAVSLGSSPVYASGGPAITTVAGNGTLGYSGDGGSATSAEMDLPEGVAIDPNGNLVIADTYNGVIRIVAASTGTFYGQSMTSGEIYTVGTTSDYPKGVTLDANGNIVFAATGDGTIDVVAASTGTFYGQSMTVGNTYIVAGGGGTFPGDGDPATSVSMGPEDVAVDSNGNLVIADSGNNLIRVVAATAGTFYGVAMTSGDIYTVAGIDSGGISGSVGYSGDGGPATSAQMHYPDSVTVDANDNLVIADTDNDVLRVVAASTGTFYGMTMTSGDIYTVAGNGTQGFSGDGGSATSAEMSNPEGVTVDPNGNLVIADSANCVLRVVAASTGTFYGVAMTSGDIYTVGGNGAQGFSGDGGPATSAQMNTPWAVAVESNSNLIVADSANNRIREIGSEVEGVMPTAGTPQSATAGATFATALQAQVVSFSGQPVVGATVTFTAPSSGPSGTFAGGQNTAVTDSNGIATAASFTANDTSGSYGVTASVPGLTKVGTFSLTNNAGQPASIAATAGTPQSTMVGTTFSTNLQATVTDAFDNPVPGVTVTFVAPSSGASGTFAGGLNTAVTNANGIATAATFTANGTVGSYSVTASAPGVASPTTFSLTNASGPPTSIVAEAGTPQSTRVGTAFATNLQAKVTDANGRPVVGKTVIFFGPTSGPSGTFANSNSDSVDEVTDSNGIATAPVLTANTIPGSYDFTARVVGLSSDASFALSNTPTTPASIVATAGTPQSGGVGYAFTDPMQVKVTDANGVDVDGAIVTFTAPPTGATGSFDGLQDVVTTATTDANGLATSPYFTANATPGSYHVTASVNGASTPASFSFTNLSVSGATLYVTENGNDTGNCQSQAAPCATIGYAASQAGAPPGSTIDVGPGIFSAPSFLISNVTINGSGTTVSDVGQTDGAVFMATTDVTLENLNIASNWFCPQDCGFDSGVTANGSVNLINDTVSGFYYYGVTGTGVNVIDSNINNNGSVNVGISGNIIDSVVTGGGGGPQGGQGPGGSGAFVTGTITDSTLTANLGAGVEGQGANIVGSTITDNTNGLYQGSGTVAGTIIAGNGTGHNAGSDCDGSFAVTDGGYNVSQDSSCGFLSAHHSLSGVNPQLGALQNNDGPLPTQAPATSSPALNKIPPGTIVDGITLCPGTDERGVARPQPSIGANCDMGALELIVPVGQNQSYSTPENIALVEPTGTLLTGATDANAGATSLSTAVKAKPANGSVTVKSNGSFTYTPNQNFVGTDTFTYIVTDNYGFTSKPITVTISVTGTSHAPVIKRFSPTSGKVGTVITIKGSFLAGATEVTIGSVKETITVDTASKIEVKVVKGTKTGTITVTTGGGSTSTTQTFKFT